MAEHSETVTETKTFTTCDFCSARLSQSKQCPGCGRDLCFHCGYFWNTDPWTGADNGDYHPLVCDGCHTHMLTFIARASRIRTEADEKIDAIQAEWKALCSRD